MGNTDLSQYKIKNLLIKSQQVFWYFYSNLVT